MIDLGIAMNQNVAQSDNAPIIRYSRHSVRVDLGELIQGLTDNLELSLNA
jgi:hypothetical protein